MSHRDPSHQNKTRFIRAHSQFEGPEDLKSGEPNSLIERAQLEAAAIAWSTDYPFLLLPCLTEELENEAREYSEKQRQIREQSAQLFPLTFPVVSQQLAA